MKVKLPINRVEIGGSGYPVQFRYYEYSIDPPRISVSIAVEIPYQEWLEKGRPMDWVVDIQKLPKP